MTDPREFEKIVRERFPEGRLTSQKGIATFHPESGPEAADLIRLANQKGQKLFITGFGNNIDPHDKRFASLVVIRSDRLNYIKEPERLKVVVGSGFPLREINKYLKSFELYLPLGDLPYVGSVGGALAVGLTADRDDDESGAATALPISRFTLALKVATPTGELKTYGTTYEKDPSGENFARALTPSWGLFGFIESATLRVIPLSAREEYPNLRQREVSHSAFLHTTFPKAKFSIIADKEKAQSKKEADFSSYMAKIRAKLDPNEIFPIVNASPAFSKLKKT
ncbi:MAG: FAD-binding oxidoreductase [candidate division Zixibacteria bacterium]|nr:FAD-binding oxidoreductase [candidate division Zixibacteria bacterium]